MRLIFVVGDDGARDSHNAKSDGLVSGARNGDEVAQWRHSAERTRVSADAADAVNRRNVRCHQSGDSGRRDVVDCRLFRGALCAPGKRDARLIDPDRESILISSSVNPTLVRGTLIDGEEAFDVAAQ